jgi:hypothetical protein
LVFVLSVDIFKVFVSNKIRHKLTLNNVVWLNKIAGASMVLFGVVLLYKVLFDAGGLGH